MSTSKKIITVFGATGNQGGSVVRTLLKDAKTAAHFHVRAVTRNTSKPAAQALAHLGAELVTADLDDVASVEAVVQGAHGVFAVTNFWESFSAEKEEAQGKAMANACKAADVQHLIWSSTLNVNELSNGTLPHVYHFDSKARVESHIRSLSLPATFLLAGVYMSNFPSSNFREHVPGTRTFALPIQPTTPMPLFAAENDTGIFVKAILLNRERSLGMRVLGATEYYTPERVVEGFKEVFPVEGGKVEFKALPEQAFKGIMKGAGMGEVIAQDMWEMFRWIEEFGYYNGASLEESLKLLMDPPTTWKQYASKAEAFAGLH